MSTAINPLIAAGSRFPVGTGQPDADEELSPIELRSFLLRGAESVPPLPLCGWHHPFRQRAGTMEHATTRVRSSTSRRQTGRQATLKQRLDEVHHDYYGADDGLRISRQHFLGVKAQTSGNVPCR